MTEHVRDTVTATARALSSAVARWSTWIGYAAFLWSLMYGVLGLYWTLGGAGFPFGYENDSNAGLSILAGMRAATGAPVIAALGVVGAAAALVMAESRGRGRFRPAFLVFAWAVAAVLTLVIPDYRVLQTAAETPIVLVGVPLGLLPGASPLDGFTWPVVNQFVCIGGGVLWAATAVVYWRRSRDACGNCGWNDTTVAEWTAPTAAATWGRQAVYVSFVVPTVYVVTRWAWVLGIPFGVSETFLREGRELGIWSLGAALAAVAMGGALLTLGLVHRWGEVFPRWLPFLGGRRVPIWLAVVPASLVSVLVTASGLMFVRLTLTGNLDAIFGEGTLAFSPENWAVLAPELLWPIWGVALGAATLAYYYRRRDRCQHCGRSPVD